MIHFKDEPTYKITVQQAHIIRAALQDLIKNGPVDEQFGICFNLKEKLHGSFATKRISYYLVTLLAARWKHSKEPGVQSSYPVPTTPDMWKDEGLKYRIDLMRYMRKRLKDAIYRASDNGKSFLK